MRRPGFTFVELVAVIALMALLAGAAAWSMGGEIRRASREDAIVRLAHADRMARLTARRFNAPMTLTLDLDRQRVTYQLHNEAREQAAQDVQPVMTALPPSHRLDRVSMLSEGGVTTLDAGQVEIAVSSAGRSPTYALRLASNNDAPRHTDNRNNTPGPWLLVAGLTGQTTHGYDDIEIDNLLTRLASRRPDAD